MKPSNDHPWKKRFSAEREGHRFTREDHPEGRPFTSDNQPKGEIPVANLLLAFQKSGLSKGELARRLGWTKVVPNVQRVRQCLGLDIQTATGKKRQRVTYETALRLCLAMNADIHEVGV